MTVCVTVVLKVLAKVEIMIPSYGFCAIPPCEEFADSVCDEFFSLPLFPPATLCDEDALLGNNAGGCCNACHSCNGCNSCNGCGSTASSNNSNGCCRRGTL